MELEHSLSAWSLHDPLKIGLAKTNRVDPILEGHGDSRCTFFV